MAKDEQGTMAEIKDKPLMKHGLGDEAVGRIAASILQSYPEFNHHDFCIKILSLKSKKILN